MKVVTTALPEVLVIEPQVFRDDRGYFMESYNQRAFDEAVGRSVEFVQDNQSHSRRGVLRGLHFQRAPHAQSKLVRALTGRIFDVAVDIRWDSPRYGQWVGIELSADNQRQLWIPDGFAHGFLVLSEIADVLYKTTAYYSPADEGSVRWNDPLVAIDWPLLDHAYTLSTRDAVAPELPPAIHLG